MLRLLHLQIDVIRKYKYDNVISVSNEDGTTSVLNDDEQGMINKFQEKYQDMLVYHIIKTTTGSDIEYDLLVVSSDDNCIAKAKHYLIHNEILVYSVIDDQLKYIEIKVLERGVIKVQQEESVKMSVVDYIKLFDDTFDTNIAEDMKNKEFTLLNFAFENMGEELFIPSEKHKEIRSKRSTISNQILKTYSYEEEKLFSDYWELEGEMDTDINKQMLIFGYCLAYQQLKEMRALKDGI